MLFNKKGMTLMELIVIIALFSVVMGGIFSLLMAGNNYFERSRLKSNIQFEVRKVADIIRNEVRYATELNLITTLDADLNYDYIAIDSANSKITLNGNDISPLFDITVTEIWLEADAGENLVLHYKLTGEDDSTFGTKSYSVMTKVLLNNIRYYEHDDHDDDGDLVLPTSGVALKYRFVSFSP